MVEDAAEILIGNFVKGQLDGFGINIVISNPYVKDTNQINPNREFNTKIGIWKKDKLDEDATKDAEFAEEKLRKKDLEEEQEVINKSKEVK